MHFYAFGVVPTHDNKRARRQAELYASSKKRAEVARRMFLRRFPGEVVANSTIQDLRGMEGKRVRALYSELGAKYGVAWRGRCYDQNNWHLADNINKAISAANASLYALCTAVICSMGYLPQLGFIHIAGTLPFVFDIADIYKPETTLEAAFHTLSINPEAGESEVLRLLKLKMEEIRLIRRIPEEIEELLYDSDSRK
jgi:CRISPR-associated protein Cas1